MFFVGFKHFPPIGYAAHAGGTVKRHKRFLTTGDVAKYCAVSHLTVVNWIRAGKLTASRTPGGHNRIRREDLLQFLVEHKFPVPPELVKEGKQILVVDDERPLAEVMAQTLQDDGYQVSMAFDGYEAGLKMATLKPDLLVLDLIMPGLDGFSICQRVKANPDAGRTKILAMTRFIQEGNFAKAFECGADLCLEKPFQLETLKAMVARLLGSTRDMTGLAVGSERRRSLRIAVEFPVQCTSIARMGPASTVPSHGKTLNVSREGALLALDAGLEPFGLVALQISLPHTLKPIHLVGEARWTRDSPEGEGYFVGLSFVAISARERERLAEEIYASWPTRSPTAV
jgi:excisionase family DNA binding protein